jgi:Rps23 Pro-64 3,4-dihydroxylase Tpa1-like proline 4-hydroxylase
MTPKQILDSFSATLMQDERILSAPERALLATLLQHAKAATTEKPETQEAVRAVIASAVGETVAQRAFAVLGGSILERILADTSIAQPDTHAEKDSAGSPDRTYLKTPSPGQPQAPGTPVRTPMPPSPGQPQAPGVHAPHRDPQSPGQPMRDTPVQPQPPRGLSDHGVVAKASAAVMEQALHLPARCVVLDEFLAPQELEELTRFVLAHEADFSASEVVSTIGDVGVVNDEHRRSRVLLDLKQYQDLMLERIKTVLPQVLQSLGMKDFSIKAAEVQATASNDGDFFHFHSDNGSDPVASRHLTFVYFFQSEPKQFEGGELRIHDARLEGDSYVSEGTYQTITPRQNQIVFFPCELMHEITPVKCASQRFADSRFTLNGWLRR